MLVVERTKAEQKQESFDWEKMTEVLNAEGPAVKCSSKWRQVCLIIINSLKGLIYNILYLVLSRL